MKGQDYKIRRIQLVSLIIVLLLMLTGCSNQMYSMSYSPINVMYAAELSNVSLGMRKEQLISSLPTLVPRGQNLVGSQQIEALELQHNYWSGVGGQLIYDRLWFYFVDEALVRWGQPNDWPTDPDLIIENRQR
jgi:hypothetical protein